MPPSFFSMKDNAAWMYAAYELAHASAQPYRTFAGGLDRMMNHPGSPFAKLPAASAVRAGWRVIDELTKRYSKPEFGIESVELDGSQVDVQEEVGGVWPFCRLLRFRKGIPSRILDAQPKVLIIAPMSGHYATLLRGTVRGMLPEHDVYITDWTDARSVPTIAGAFDLDDYIEYLMTFFRKLGPSLHVIAVCQPSVPALAATALLAQANDPCQPISLTLMAGPVDVAINPTVVNDYANEHDVPWFQRNTVSLVPFPHPGALRAVYPGFLQLAGFMGMNADAHVQAYGSYFGKLIEGDADSVSGHRRFYDEYLAVMDVTAEYFLQTIRRVFQDRALAKGEFDYRGQRVDCSAIRNTTLMTIEGERDDICGIGQTEAAHALCTSLDEQQRHHYVQPGVGHYGVFNGSRWRTEIQPRIAQMIRAGGL
jgi:poly(3-hydroxybutyrate) depolymerase